MASKDCQYFVNQIDSKVSKIIREGFNYYWVTKDYDENTLTLSDKDWDVCNTCVNNVLSNLAMVRTLKPVDDFLDPIPSFNEDTLFLDVAVLYKDRYTILKLKAKLDNWTIDVDNKILTLNDLKTTSKPLGWFMNNEYGSFKKYHYARQFAMYRFMLEAYCNSEYGYNHNWQFKGNVLTVNTTDFNSKLFTVNKSQFIDGKNEYEQLLKRVAFYEMFGYDQQVEFK